MAVSCMQCVFQLYAEFPFKNKKPVSIGRGHRLVHYANPGCVGVGVRFRFPCSMPASAARESSAAMAVSAKLAA